MVENAAPQRIGGELSAAAAASPDRERYIRRFSGERIASVVFTRVILFGGSPPSERDQIIG
jgi:hypothetical protein